MDRSKMFVGGPHLSKNDISMEDGFMNSFNVIKDGFMDLKNKITGPKEDDQLILAINNLNKTLNTNNMIASMIERNTKSTNNNLANMSGSLV